MWVHPEIVKLLQQQEKKSKEEIEILVSPSGGLQSSWWNETIDEILSALGVAASDRNRNPFCG